MSFDFLYFLSKSSWSWLVIMDVICHNIDYEELERKSA